MHSHIYSSAIFHLPVRLTLFSTTKIMASECCSPFSSQTQNEPLFVKKEEEVEPKPEVVQIKEENIEFEVDDDYYDGRDCFRGSYDYANVVLPYLPKPMDCLLETGPPPFLIKTFQMVDDPKTDTVVSWSPHRLSFVVWDCYEFSKTILPKFFKHSNFSSFIRQLNTYGFRKVDPDRWEFANEGFQGGKKHLLKSIKRRSRCKRPTQGINVSVNSAKNSGLDSQVETLKKGQDVLKVKILNLKQQQKYLQHQVNAFDERLRRSEFKQQRMLLFLTKTTTEPDFVQRLMQKRVSRGELEGGDYGKRRRLLATQGFEDFGDCRLPEAKDITRSLPAFLGDKSCSSVENNKRQEEVHSIYDMSEKLLKENSVFDDECAVNDSNFYQELEDLIAMPHNLDDSIVKPHDWSAYVSNYLVEQPDCVASIP